ncbi:MAG: hypothetical protein JST48_02925 [Bacteroidetes bacterium]|nr:hypothetical protein [Bacteroidota bacterium]
MKITCLLGLYLIISLTILAQSPCPLNGISTDPNNPVPANSGFKTNTFNWMDEVFHPYNDQDYTSRGWITNFFYYSNTFYSSFIQGVASDFYPKDGWELIKRDFGLLSDESINVETREGPYFILYNKYSGKLRVIGTFPGIGTQQAILVTLRLIPPEEKVGKKPSAILGLYGNNAQTLDQKTAVTTVVSPASCPGMDIAFFMADFQMAYDACTCQFESGLNIYFSTLETADLKLYGRGLGTEDPINIFTEDASINSLDATRSFLTSVYAIPANGIDQIEAGHLIYKDINSLTNDYKSKSSSADFLALDFFGSVLTMG